MSIITLTTDYGIGSFYLAALKAALYKVAPAAVLMDLDNCIKPHDIVQAAFVVRSTINQFPEKTIHLISIDNSETNAVIVAEYNGQHIVAFDNGLFSLLFDETQQVKYYRFSKVALQNSFPELTLFPQVLEIIQQQKFELVEPAQPKLNMQSLLPSITDNGISGSVIYVDGYNNAITNISKNVFEKKLQTKPRFEIVLRRKMAINKLSQNYTDVKQGSELALFNHLDLLEIAINKGESAQLLGLHTGAKIIIEFYD